MLSSIGHNWTFSTLISTFFQINICHYCQNPRVKCSQLKGCVTYSVITVYCINGQPVKANALRLIISIHKIYSWSRVVTFLRTIVRFAHTHDGFAHTHEGFAHTHEGFAHTHEGFAHRHEGFAHTHDRGFAHSHEDLLTQTRICSHTRGFAHRHEDLPTRTRDLSTRTRKQISVLYRTPYRLVSSVAGNATESRV